MLEKLNKSQKRKIIGSFASTALLGLVVVLAAVMYFNSALGWFVNSKDIQGSGMGASVEGAKAEAEYTLYIFNAKENTVRYTDDGRDDKDPKITDFDMQVHDVIFKSRNRYTPAVVYIHAYDLQQDLQSGGRVSVTLTRNEDPAFGYNDHGGLQLPEKSTSILRYTLASNSGTSWLGTDADPYAAAQQTYNNIDAALYDKIVNQKNYASVGNISVASGVFTTVTKNSETRVITEITKTGSVTLTVDYTAEQVTDGELDLFLYITYDEDLVNSFEQSAGIDTDSTAVGKITTLENDLTELVISFGN